MWPSLCLFSSFQRGGNLLKQLIRVQTRVTAFWQGRRHLCPWTWVPQAGGSLEPTLRPAALISGCLAGMHCVLSLGEETEGADKEALPVEPDKRRKASAEERLDTVLDFENTTGEGSGTNTPSPPALCGWYCLLLEGNNRGSLDRLCRRWKQQVGSGKAFFRSVQQTCFADRSSPSWKRINEWEGCLSFPQKVFPGASKTLCPVKHLRPGAVVKNK